MRLRAHSVTGDLGEDLPGRQVETPRRVALGQELPQHVGQTRIEPLQLAGLDQAAIQQPVERLQSALPRRLGRRRRQGLHGSPTPEIERTDDEQGQREGGRRQLFPQAPVAAYHIRRRLPGQCVRIGLFGQDGNYLDIDTGKRDDPLGAVPDHGQLGLG